MFKKVLIRLAFNETFLYNYTFIVIIYIYRKVLHKMDSYNKFKENAKFQHIIATARNLFFRYGMKRVTIEEICRESGVSKVTFYKFFPNKIELATYLLTSIYDEATAQYREIIDRNEPFPDKLLKLLDLKRSGTEQISAEFIAELIQRPEPGVAELYKKQFEISMNMTLEFMQKAQKNGDIRPEIKLEFIMYMMNKTLEMSMDESLAKLYETPQDQIMELMNFFFYGILKR